MDGEKGREHQRKDDEMRSIHTGDQRGRRKRPIEENGRFMLRPSFSTWIENGF